MAAPVVTFNNATAEPYVPMGGLPGGYYISQGSSALRLQSCDDPATLLDSETAYTYSPWNAQTASGELYYIAASAFGATSIRLYRIEQASGALTVTTIGDVTLGSNAALGLSVSPDGSEVAVPWFDSPNYGVKVLSTADASIVSDITTGGSDLQRTFAAGGGRVIEYNVAGSQWKLHNASGTLDTLAWAEALESPYPPMVKPITDDRFLVVAGIDETPSPTYFRAYVGVLTTFGDVLAMEWDTSYTTTWPFADASTWGVVTSTCGEYGVIVPRYPFTVTGGTAEFYMVNTTTGIISGTGSTSDIGGSSAGAFDRTLFFAGVNTVLWWNTFSTDSVRVWDVAYPTGPTFLRLHQSPVMTPSRVRGVDLRQSQTPRITR